MDRLLSNHDVQYQDYRNINDPSWITSIVQSLHEHQIT